MIFNFKSQENFKKFKEDIQAYKDYCMTVERVQYMQPDEEFECSEAEEIKRLKEQNTDSSADPYAETAGKFCSDELSDCNMTVLFEPDKAVTYLTRIANPLSQSIMYPYLNTCVINTGDVNTKILAYSDSGKVLDISNGIYNKKISNCMSKLKLNILVLGLGFGYPVYRALTKTGLQNVTVVEKDAKLIEFFTKNILPSFPSSDKLTIVNADPLDYVSSVQDTVFNCCYVHNVEKLKSLKSYLMLRRNILANFSEVTAIKFTGESGFLALVANSLFDTIYNTAMLIKTEDITDYQINDELSNFVSDIAGYSISSINDVKKIMSSTYLGKALNSINTSAELSDEFDMFSPNGKDLALTCTVKENTEENEETEKPENNYSEKFEDIEKSLAAMEKKIQELQTFVANSVAVMQKSLTDCIEKCMNAEISAISENIEKYNNNISTAIVNVNNQLDRNYRQIQSSSDRVNKCNIIMSTMESNITVQRELLEKSTENLNTAVLNSVQKLNANIESLNLMLESKNETESIEEEEKKKKKKKKNKK